MFQTRTIEKGAERDNADEKNHAKKVYDCTIIPSGWVALKSDAADMVDARGGEVKGDVSE